MVVVSIEGAEEWPSVVAVAVVVVAVAVVVAVGVGEMPTLTLSFISITSTFTSSLLSLGEPCLESRPGFGFGFGFGLFPVNLRHPKKKKRRVRGSV